MQQKGHSALSSIELLRIVSLKEAARLAGVSEKTLKDRFPEKIVPRGGRTGMRVGHALGLLTETETVAI